MQYICSVIGGAGGRTVTNLFDELCDSCRDDEVILDEARGIFNDGRFSIVC